jgi:hypothetical protein
MARDGDGMGAHGALTVTPVGGYDATSFDAVAERMAEGEHDSRICPAVGRQSAAAAQRRAAPHGQCDLNHELVVEVVPFGITSACCS